MFPKCFGLTIANSLSRRQRFRKSHLRLPLPETRSLLWSQVRLLPERLRFHTCLLYTSRCAVLMLLWVFVPEAESGRRKNAMYGLSIRETETGSFIVKLFAGWRIRHRFLWRPRVTITGPDWHIPVSYTHLDVSKRQPLTWLLSVMERRWTFPISRIQMWDTFWAAISTGMILLPWQWNL